MKMEIGGLSYAQLIELLQEFPLNIVRIMKVGERTVAEFDLTKTS